MALTDRHNDNLESLDAEKENADVGKVIVGRAGRVYSADYIDATFMKWYSAGKPALYKLLRLMPNPKEFGLDVGLPSETTLKVWYREIFVERGAALDEEVSRKMAEMLVAEKVQMLNNHVELAATMQKMALEYLEENKDKMNAPTAVRMLVEAVRIERESRGIPRTLEKMANISDTDLMKEIEDLLTRSPVDITPVDDDAV